MILTRLADPETIRGVQAVAPKQVLSVLYVIVLYT